MMNLTQYSYLIICMLARGLFDHMVPEDKNTWQQSYYITKSNLHVFEPRDLKHIKMLLLFLFSGSVIGPTFHFDVNKIRFDNVSYGFLNTFHCTLTNTALVPMTFNLRVPNDGLAESASGSEIESTFSEAGSLIPKEFEITPARGKTEHCL